MQGLHSAAGLVQYVSRGWGALFGIHIRLSLSFNSCKLTIYLLLCREVFSHVSANDLANPYLVLNEISKDLSKLDFVVVFASERVSGCAL